MMKKQNDWLKGIAGLAVVSVLVITLALLFRAQQHTPLVQTPLQTTLVTLIVQPTAPVTETMVPPTLYPTDFPSPTGTVAPRHLGPATEVPVPDGFLAVEGLKGDSAVGIVRVDTKNQIVLIDLNSQDMWQISSATEVPGKYSSRISNAWIVWAEEIELPDRSIDRRLKVYDRKQEREFALEGSAPDLVDLSGDVVVWQEWGGEENNWDILAHNLRTGQRWSFGQRPGTQWYPRISGSWVLYIQLGDYTFAERTADLRAFNLETGEDVLVGQVFNPHDASEGTFHAIGGSTVVWIPPVSPPDYACQFLSLDLNGLRAARSLPIPNCPGDLQLFEDILAYHELGGKVLYDLTEGRPLATVESVNDMGVEELFISGDRVIWDLWDSRNDRASLFTARIGR